METTFVKPNHRILVIDDNPAIHGDFRKVLRPDTPEASALLEMEGVLFEQVQSGEPTLSFQLDSAYQGQEGFEMVKAALAEHRPYALAFVDVRMPPGWDGVETIARIWKVDPGIQIVLCTAYADYSWEQLRAKVGQPDSLVVLKKPFDNLEVQQLAHALTKKWLLNLEAGLKLAELEAMVQRRTAELAQVNQSLAASEERFSTAFHASPIPSGILTLPERRFVDANERLVTLTECHREELVGRTSGGLFLWEQPELVEEWFEQLARKDEVREAATKVRRRSGALRDVLVSLVPISLGGLPHALLLAQDIPELLLLERQYQQAQKMEAIGRLAGGVAHDFNNMLGVIAMNADMMKQAGGLTPEQLESAEEIGKAAKRSANLTRQLLLYSRRQVLQPRDLDLNDAVSHMAKMLQRIMGEDVQIQIHPSAQPLWLHADAGMLDQVLLNLAVNSREAMPTGGRLIIETAAAEFDRTTAAQHAGARPGSFVCLTVRDTGCGIPPEVLPNIFDPFFTTKDVGKGTGLGLATVFSVVQQHQGWVSVQSDLGRGTTFLIYLPRIDHSGLTASSDTKFLSLKGGQETILLVEDESAFRTIVRAVLTRLGYRVLDATSGVKALDVWQEHRSEIRLLLTDLVMPDGMSGKDLALRLQAQEPKLKVIYTSGYSADIAGPDFPLREGDNFLAKPFHASALAQIIRARLDD